MTIELSVVFLCEGRSQVTVFIPRDRWDVDNIHEAEYISAMHKVVLSCEISVDIMVEDIGRCYLQRDTFSYRTSYGYRAHSKHEQRVRHGLEWLFL